MLTIHADKCNCPNDSRSRDALNDSHCVWSPCPIKFDGTQKEKRRQEARDQNEIMVKDGGFCAAYVKHKQNPGHYQCVQSVYPSSHCRFAIMPVCFRYLPSWLCGIEIS